MMGSGKERCFEVSSEEVGNGWADGNRQNRALGNAKWKRSRFGLAVPNVPSNGRY